MLTKTLQLAALALGSCYMGLLATTVLQIEEEVVTKITVICNSVSLVAGAVFYVLFVFWLKRSGR